VVFGCGTFLPGASCQLFCLWTLSLAAGCMLLCGDRGLFGASHACVGRVAMPSRDDAVLITPIASTLGSHHRDQRDQKHKYDDGDDEAARYKERHSDSLHLRLRKPNTSTTRITMTTMTKMLNATPFGRIARGSPVSHLLERLASWEHPHALPLTKNARGELLPPAGWGFCGKPAGLPGCCYRRANG
jgi:hypothetical protein